MAKSHDYVPVEENSILGGAGSAVLEYLASEQILKTHFAFRFADIFIEHGIHEQMRLRLWLRLLHEFINPSQKNPQ